MKLSHDDLVRLANNPVRGINRVVNAVEENWFEQRVSINSKTHPFVLATDLILGTTHGLLNRVDDGISKLFPVHARNITDLSKHMSDEERIGIFATPSSAVLQIAIEEQTFLSISKEEIETMGNSTMSYQTLLIPKDTEVKLPGYIYSINNGVKIRFNEKTGYQVVYDESTNNSFFPIENNLLKRKTVILGDKTYLLVDVPAKQLSCKVTENISSNESSGCSGEITYTDYLFGVKAYLVQGNRLRELRVTYDQDVFDPATTTLALNIDTTNRVIKYEIPDVYISNRSGLGTVRIYTYTTKGELNRDLSDVETGSIEPNYQDYRFGAGTLGAYSSKLKSTGGIAWRALGFSSGGRNALDFEVIKNNFINGRRTRQTPITESNLIGMVNELGYGSVKTIDFVTDRTYSVTKELPLQHNKKFWSPMSCYVGSHLTSVNDLVSSGVAIDNGRRVTIPHDVLFDISAPTSVLVNQYNKDRYLGMSNEELVSLSNSATLVYTPFYYVMDTTNDQATIRTYHLDQPKVKYQSFKEANSSLGLEVGIDSISVEHLEDGYLVTVTTESGNSYKKLDNDQIGVQLSVSPIDSSTKASIRGNLVGVGEDGERAWEFKLESNFDLDSNNVLYLNNMFQFGSIQPLTGVDLELELSFIFTLAGDNQGNSTNIDSNIEDGLFTQPMIGIIETTYLVELGKEMENIYSRVRPLVGEGQYKKHLVDVPATYPKTVFKRDAEGELVVEGGELVIEHNAGDIIYSDSGLPELKHQAGDYVYEDGKLVEVAPKELKYHWDFIGFDANYFFSRDQYDVEFAQETKDFFVNVTDKDITYFRESSLDRTTLVYKPKNKLGYQKVVVNNNFESYIKQDLSFEVLYYLTPEGNRNQNLKANLKQAASTIINQSLYNAMTVSIDKLIEKLMEGVPKEVLSVKLDGLGGNTTIDVISSLDELNGFSVRKQLTSGGDGLLSIKETVNVSFLPHGVTKIKM